ncbi:alpha-L-glutamate ligase [Inquilinus sp. CAU 1745]|uniref:ATP-grasp domain-containing protein n=1 Tax=Inquilinus sp. CAU 1745 TaxID=3140369 RepID=UPI00325B476C
MSKIHVIYENEAWLEPLARVLNEHDVPWAGWNFSEGDFDLTSRPPEGIFFNRMSASAHTRGHAHSPEYAIAALAWLERAGRRVINGADVVDLELSKVRQYAALEKAGIAVPRTTAVLGKHRLVEAARRDFGEGPVILKPNRGGKGLGVRLFASTGALADYLNGPDYEAPVDGIHLLQEYVSAPEPFITRTEFVGGKFLYAVRVDTSDGFELCPADVCAVGDAMCPVGEQPTPPKFEIVPDIDSGQKAAYERFLAENRIEFAGIEFILAPDGRVLTYDVNTNTNYNPEAEKRAGKSGMTAIAAFLKQELNHLTYTAAAAE